MRDRHRMIGPHPPHRLSHKRLLLGDQHIQRGLRVRLGVVRTPLVDRLRHHERQLHRQHIDAGGTGTDLTSIWLVGWGPNTVHGLYPENSKAGLSKEDIGEEAAFDPDGGEYRVLKTHFGWDVGLSVRDWRYVVRIANIKESLLQSVPPDENSATGHNLYELLVKAVAKVPSLSGARFAFYTNRTIETYLRLQQANSRNVQLNLADVGGRRVLSFDGIPFRRVDVLEFKEAQVK